MNTIMEIKIRRSEEKDFPQILKLVKEFAEYLGKADQVKTTVDDYIKEQDNFVCLLAETSKGEIAGYALFYYTFHTWSGKTIFLEDLFVKEKYQKQKLGTMFMCSLVDFAKQNHCKNIEWTVLDWNDKAIGFYKKIGAVVGNDNLYCTFEVK